MGERKRLLQRIKSESPFCCFCGGVTPTETVDHVPPKIMFDNKHRPKGFEFPACLRCNRLASNADQVAAMMARTYPDPKTPELSLETKRIMDAVNKNNPGLLEEIQPTIRDRRRFMKEKLGLQPGLHGSSLNIPIMKANGPILNSVMILFARKLTLAFHYHHAKKIVPLKGWVGVRWYSNIQILEEPLPKSFTNLLGAPNTLRQGKWHVGDRFVSRHTISADGFMSGHVSLFGRAFVVLGLVHCNPTEDFSIDGVKAFHPFSH